MIWIAYSLVATTKNTGPLCLYNSSLSYWKWRPDIEHINPRSAVEGDDVLDSLMDKTSSRTVPQVFIKGQYVGGADGEWRPLHPLCNLLCS